MYTILVIMIIYSSNEWAMVAHAKLASKVQTRLNGLWHRGHAG